MNFFFARINSTPHPLLFNLILQVAQTYTTNMDNKDSCHVLGHVALAVKNDGAIISSGGKKISAEGVGGGTARAVRAPTKLFVTCTIVEDKGSRKRVLEKRGWKKRVVEISSEKRGREQSENIKLEF